MPVDKCRVCGGAFFKKPLLKYDNMPKAAQYMPDEASLHLDKGADLIVYQCSACGLVQLNNDPVPYYREVIRAVGISQEMTDFRLAQFQRFIEEYNLTGKKIIEIGCGKGEFISLFNDLDAHAFGMEFSESSVRHCCENGLNVEKSFFDTGHEVLSNGLFDGFMILNFFEHLPNPGTTLAGIHRNLKDDGLGIVEVPNFDMILKNKLFSEFIGDHLFYFTQKTLIATLSRYGFEIVDCNVIWHDYIISAIVRKRRPLNMHAFYDFQETLSKEIHQYIEFFQDKKVAIWGAGHQALAIMSLTGISDKILYVIDSAPFKQGRLTPCTHIPIVPPQNLNTAPVEAVIVMAASFSDEVARIIQNDYPLIRHVAILRESHLEEILF